MAANIPVLGVGGDAEDKGRKAWVCELASVDDAMKATYCVECQHSEIKWYRHGKGDLFDVLVCAKKHAPRFYRQCHDNPFAPYGWKRVCADFETANV